MITKPSYRVFKYTLAAGQTVDIARHANTIVCLSASARFEMGVGNDPVTDFESGLTYTADQAFTTVVLTNPSAAEITIELGFASGGISDSRLSLTGAVQANIRGGGTLTDGGVLAAAETRTKVADATAARMEIMVTNMGEHPVFLGSDTVVAGQGAPLAAGKAIVLTTTAELHAYNQSTAVVPLAILEIE